MDPYKYHPSSAYNSPFFTTNSGAHVYNNNASLTVGARGPILIEDYHLVEKLANFDREQISERVAHARGASTKGFFEVNYCPSRYDPCRHAEQQERFICRWVDALSDSRVTHEIRGIWISYLSQFLVLKQDDKSLGQKIASCLNVRPNI